MLPVLQSTRPLVLALLLLPFAADHAVAQNSDARTTSSRSRTERGERARNANRPRGTQENGKRPAGSGFRNRTADNESTAPAAAQPAALPAALAGSVPTAPVADLDSAIPGTVLPSLADITSPTELLSRLDAAIAEVGIEPDFLSDDALIEDTTASQMASRVQNLLPATPLPVKELDELSSTSRGAVRISLMEALCRALEANQQLNVERLRPEVSNTSIESAWSEFDTTLQASIGASSRQSSTLGPRARNGGGGNRDEDTNVSRNQDFDVSLSGRLPTGTNYSVGFGADRSSTNRTFPFYSSALNLNITQNLLRGAGCDVNLVRVRTAQNNFVRSLYTLQQFLVNLVTDVQIEYYNLYLAMETLRIRRQAYEVARQQRLQVEEFVEVGRSAPLEALAAQAEEASRITDVINAAADLRRQQLDFLRALNPINMPGGWKTRLFPLEPPIIPSEALVPEDHIRLAQYYHPGLRQAEIDLANGELEVLRTENGLLPVLDFVAQAGTSGVGDSFGRSSGSTFSGDFRNYRVGLQFAYPLQNRAARAADRRARFERAIAEQAILNLQQIIQIEVRSAIIEIQRTRRLIESTEVTRRLREAELAAEIEKFRVGRSTQLLVNQAQRDLTTAQLQEVSARVAHIRAYLELYRADGTALQRRGIQPIWISPTSGVPSP